MTEPYKNPELSIEERVDDLIGRMTLDEKVSQMLNAAPAIERLNVPEYDWWNECLHGVGRAGIATVFPQAIGMGATWNPELMFRMAEVTSDEARAKHHQALREDNHDRYYGLTYWSPNINIFRDPRWGRGQETYGEDPYLMSKMGVAFVRGIQGDDPKYLKLVATPKHYAVHSGPEHDRHHFDAVASERDMRMTYLPAFKATVVESGAYSIMGAYNRTNGEACCASPTLLQKILREEWGFEGYVVSDCGAIGDIHAHHKIVETPEEAAALAVKNGCDLNCGGTYDALVNAVEEGLITEEEIDKALMRLFTARFKLGMFDPPEMVPYAQIPIDVNDSEEHRAVALQMARESMVLLKNDGILPLSKDVKSVAVIGPNADDETVLLGNYNGTPSESVTALGGIKAKLPGAEVAHAKGCAITLTDKGGFAEAVQAAKSADVVIAVMGISQVVEGEEGQREGAGGEVSKGDREKIGLPGVQDELLAELKATGKPLIVVLMNGSALAVNWAAENADAILEAWYSGEEGGTAIADVLFGDYNPGGRLPVTFYKSVGDLPDFRNYDMAAGFTYRYFKGDPLYPFGYGLSYTEFAYSDLSLIPATVNAGENVALSVEVENVGKVAGDEVVQVYITDDEASVPVPIRQLTGFERVHLEPGEKRKLSFTLDPQWMSIITDDGKRVVEPGAFTVTVGGGQPAGDTAYVQGTFMIVGTPAELEL